jgi:hypothetical protein
LVQLKTLTKIFAGTKWGWEGKKRMKAERKKLVRIKGDQGKNIEV